jgi:hypothetical protein
MPVGLESITLRRPDAPPGARGADGRVPAVTYTDTPLRATVQRATGRDLRVLPEGDRNVDAYLVDSFDELRVLNMADGTPPDRLVIEGDVFEVRVVDHVRQIIPHFEAVALKLQEG